MQRFYSRDTMVADQEHGQFVRYEDVLPAISDRDIKAANLQLLVEKVLAAAAAHKEAVDSHCGEWTDTYRAARAMQNEVIELALGLKQ